MKHQKTYTRLLPANLMETLQLNISLIKAISGYNTEETKRLLDTGADVNAENRNPGNKIRTPLMMAVENRFVDFSLPIIKLLLDKKPDINAVDQNGCTALMLIA